MEVASNPLGAGYAVHLAIFDGPIDLLLHLIERQELDISEVSLVAITDQYLRSIEEMQDIGPEALADFLLVAARLLYIKSRGLLPQPPVEEVEEAAGEALIQQLLEYRRFKMAAEELRMRVDIGLRTNVRLAPRPQVERTLDLSSLTIAKLFAAAQKTLLRLPESSTPPQIQAYTITVAEQIAAVRSRISSHNGEEGGGSVILPFSALLSHSRSRLEIVVTFLAVLELIKLREIAVEQEEMFGEIVLRSVM